MKIGIAGCTGRMGLALIKAVSETEDMTLSAGSIRPDQAVPDRDYWLGCGVASGEVPVVTNAQALVAQSDMVIDFTSPASTLALAEQAAATGTPLIIGTTGLANAQFEVLEHFANSAPLLWASNMSVGVTLLNELVREVAKKLDPDFDIEVVEMHHRHKVDAPSGTALSLGRAAAEGRQIDFDAMANLSREGHTGARPIGEIGFATLRGGDVIGDHTVIFAGPGERIELTHKSSSRSIYAYGALRAVRWLKGKPAGLYTMHDVLNA
ncbi:MAG: 4-hydroxy-tetrahydrodipicolinate reductase [Alphaproteobacteria bacterium]|nr:4-hydroxy-tetrahydrodipicolinate reductase [Alphaproteobacteria bacterium]